MIITTVHGTKFKIDQVNKTWERTDKTGDSGNLRDESGTFFEITEAIIGEPLTLKCPPRVEGALYRLIITSPITAVEQ